MSMIEVIVYALGKSEGEMEKARKTRDKIHQILSQVTPLTDFRVKIDTSEITGEGEGWRNMITFSSTPRDDAEKIIEEIADKLKIWVERGPDIRKVYPPAKKQAPTAVASSR